MRSIADDLLDGLELSGLVDKGGFLFPLVIFIKMGVSDGIYVNMVRRSGRRFVGGVVSFDVNFMENKEESGFVDRFITRKGSISPVDNWVGGMKPGEFKDDIVF